VAWVDINGIDIHYSEAGSGQALLFLHGSGSCAENWHRQLAEFKTDHRVITYSSVNHGHSANSPRNEPEPDRADELEGVLASLDVSRPIISGHSMGGATVVRWACRHPADARALIVSGMGIARDGSGLPRPIQQIGPEQIFPPPNPWALSESFFLNNPREVERYTRCNSTATRI
jgi:pimeloyl-ACP methyl ester carboxylesterase